MHRYFLKNILLSLHQKQHFQEDIEKNKKGYHYFEFFIPFKYYYLT